MKNKFWCYSIWYLILVLLTVIMVALTAVKTKKWKQTIARYFSFVGVTFFIEWPILVIFKGYVYYPMIMKEPFDDSMLGNVISQTSLAATAILIAVYNLPFLWNIIFSMIYALIEISFERLGIYEHYWYSTWYTFFGLIAYFTILKGWYRKINSSPGAVTKHAALFLGVFSVYSPCIEWAMRMLRIYQFKVNLLNDPIRNHINDYVIYALIVLNFIIIIYKSNLNLVLKLFSLSGIYLINYLLVEFDMLFIKRGWFFICSSIAILFNYVLVILFDRMFGFRNKADPKTESAK